MRRGAFDARFYYRARNGGVGCWSSRYAALSCCGVRESSRRDREERVYLFRSYCVISGNGRRRLCASFSNKAAPFCTLYLFLLFLFFGVFFPPPKRTICTPRTFLISVCSIRVQILVWRCHFLVVLFCVFVFSYPGGGGGKSMRSRRDHNVFALSDDDYHHERVACGVPENSLRPPTDQPEGAGGFPYEQ